jgi:hypothetical protein
MEGDESLENLSRPLRSRAPDKKHPNHSIQTTWIDIQNPPNVPMNYPPLATIEIAEEERPDASSPSLSVPE